MNEGQKSTRARRLSEIFVKAKENELAEGNARRPALKAEDNPKNKDGDKILKRAIQILDEAKKQVDSKRARVDAPRFAGDQRHVHVPLQKGHEASWNSDGRRRHPNKFPSVVPQAAKEIAAKKLGVSADILESLLGKRG